MQLFILLFLLSHVAVVTAVTGCLADRDKDHRPRENCTAAGFTDIPSGFEPSTKVTHRWLLKFIFVLLKIIVDVLLTRHWTLDDTF